MGTWGNDSWPGSTLLYGIPIYGTAIPPAGGGNTSRKKNVSLELGLLDLEDLMMLLSLILE